MPTLVRALFVATALILSSCRGTEGIQPLPGEPVLDSTWLLVWSDEFDGSALDASKWSFQIGDGCAISLCGWGNNELQWYQPDNVSVGGGMLTITARAERAGGVGAGGGPGSVVRDYTSSRIRSLGKGVWRYGRIDVRARLPIGQGLWPAIWMMPTDSAYGAWAASGEIDIVELVGHEPDRVHGTLHYGGTWPGNEYTGAAYVLDRGTFADDFHVFTLEWQEGEIRWYVDGEHYQTQTEWFSSRARYPAPFDQRFHLILNVAVGGDWPGAPSASTRFPQSMQVDYVRVYRKID